MSIKRNSQIKIETKDFVLDCALGGYGHFIIMVRNTRVLVVYHIVNRTPVEM